MSALESFHFLRPLWLLAMPVFWLIIFIGWRIWKNKQDLGRWIDQSLLVHLIDNESQQLSRQTLVFSLIAVTLAVLAVAGPAWEKIPQPVEKSDQALVILLDLSPSMMAEDITPSRLTRTRYKITDLLNQRKDGLTALIVYAGEAYTVTPLSDDTETISALLPSLSPAEMPISGSNVEMAYDMAIELLENAGHSTGDIILFTDGIATNASDYLIETANTQYPLSIIGVGTPEGAPIPINSGGFAKNRDGSIVLAKLETNRLKDVAARSRGTYRALTSNNDDLNAISTHQIRDNNQTREVDREYDQWIDRGGYLALLLIPFAAYAFRRGLILPTILLGVAITMPQPASAFTWQDLWQTADQQGMEAQKSGNHADAAEKFKDPLWKGSAAYQAGDYQAAISAFEKIDTPQAHYNRGNALAKSGELEKALDAYDQALSQQPEFEDALTNKQLIEELLKQQQQDQQSSNENNESDQNNQDSESSENNQQQDSSEQDASDQNNENQSDSEQNQDSAQNGHSDEGQEDSESKSANNEEQETPESEQKQTQSETSDEDSAEGQQQAAQQITEQDTNNAEEQQALEQWLRKINDDPSGLMREKFNYEYKKRRNEYQRGEWQPPENGALQRW